jgi:hypothetical protein
MSIDTENKEHRKLEELLKELISRVVDVWTAGEGSVTVEVGDTNNDKKAKISGGPVTRIR